MEDNMIPHYSPETILRRLADDGATQTEQFSDLRLISGMHAQKIAAGHGERMRRTWSQLKPLLDRIQQLNHTGELARDLADYVRDAGERAVLTLDVLRERGNNDIAHEQAGTPPVLVYDYEVVLDGRDFDRPVNYFLLKITPPEGVETLDWKRPYMIIDPRAGHGAGIGGFKPDSQVGVALRNHHPVYFVVFRPQPEANQTLSDVMRAEAAFVAEIRRRHPDAPKPIIVGNCQGGWATLVLAAANPDISGPLVINGAPVAAWSGRKGGIRCATAAGCAAASCRLCWRPISAAAFSTAPIWCRISRRSIQGAISSANITTSSPTSRRRAKASSTSSAGGAAST